MLIFYYVGILLGASCGQNLISSEKRTGICRTNTIVITVVNVVTNVDSNSFHQNSYAAILASFPILVLGLICVFYPFLVPSPTLRLSYPELDTQ